MSPNPNGTPGELQRRRYVLTAKGWAATQPADQRQDEHPEQSTGDEQAS